MKTTTRLLTLLLLVNSLPLFAQNDTVLFGYRIQYYEFEQDIQMVEITFGITNFGALLQQYPNGMPSRMPNHNIYLFRNKQGKVIKAYNLCGYSLDDFTLTPPNQIPLQDIKKYNAQRFRIMKGCYRDKQYDEYVDIEHDKTLYGVVDRQGNIVLPAQYESIGYAPGMKVIVAQHQDKMGLLDLNGKIVQPFEFDQSVGIQYYNSGFPAVAHKDGKFYYINLDGEIINQRPYDYAEMFWSKMGLFKVDGKFGYIDSMGREVIPPIYETAESFYYTIAIVGDGEKYGMIDSVGNIVQPIIYDRIKGASGDPTGVFTMGYQAEIGNEQVLINLQGQRVTDQENNPQNEILKRIDLKPIKMGDITFCEEPKIIQQVQLNGKGAEEVLIFRRCRGDISRHGGSYDDDQSYLMEKYEVWNVNANKLLFEVITRYSHDYNIWYVSRGHSRGRQYYECILDMDDQGKVTISDEQEHSKGEEMPTFIYEGVISSTQNSLTQANSINQQKRSFMDQIPGYKGEGEYMYRDGHYRAIEPEGVLDD